MKTNKTGSKLKKSLRVQFPVSRWKLVKKSITRLGGPIIGIVTMFATLLATLAYFNAVEFDLLFAFMVQQKKPLFFVVTALLIWIASFPVYQYFYYRTYFYDCDEQNLYIRKGVIAKREIVLPFSRITDVYLEGDLLDVVFGLRDLHFSTPTIQSGKLAHIDGLSKTNANLLEKMLIEKVNLHTPSYTVNEIKSFKDSALRVSKG